MNSKLIWMLGAQLLTFTGIDSMADSQRAATEPAPVVVQQQLPAPHEETEQELLDRVGGMACDDDALIRQYQRNIDNEKAVQKESGVVNLKVIHDNTEALLLVKAKREKVVQALNAYNNGKKYNYVCNEDNE